MSGLFRVVAMVALLAAGCAGEQQPGSEASGGGGPASGASPTSTGAESSSSAAPTTGPIGGPPLSTPTGGGPSSTGTRPQAECAAPGSVRITAGAVPDPVCLPVNGMLKLASDPSPHQPWGPLVSSDPKILSCTSDAGTSGAVSGVCTPHLPGTVTVSTTTGPFAGDPHGPAQFHWELRVTVVAYGLN
jgi:hypothetical protein